MASKDFFNWMLRNRRTGRITTVQTPNRAQRIFMGVTAAGVLLPNGRVRIAAGEVAVLAAAWWGVDELLRGVNPLRRLSGALVLGTLAFSGFRRKAASS